METGTTGKIKIILSDETVKQMEEVSKASRLAEIAMFKYVLHSLCTAELSNKGRQFLINEIKLRGGNYTK